MQFSVEKINFESIDYLKIKLKPELLNLANKDVLKEYIGSEIKNKNKNFIFDLSEIVTLNSSALGVLIGILNQIKSADGNLKFSNYNEKIKAIFEITKLNLVFDLI